MCLWCCRKLNSLRQILGAKFCCEEHRAAHALRLRQQDEETSLKLLVEKPAFTKFSEWNSR
jgi:hypothetical protein